MLPSWVNEPRNILCITGMSFAKLCQSYLIQKWGGGGGEIIEVHQQTNITPLANVGDDMRRRPIRQVCSGMIEYRYTSPF
jgi:hypothetical protein